MKPLELLREILISAWVLKTASSTIAAIAAIISLASLLTVGRAAAAEELLAQRLDEAGSRTVSVVDTGVNELINEQIIKSLNNLDAVEEAFGMTVVEDVYNTNIGPGSQAVPARVVSGDLPSAVRLIEGRWPGPGEAIITAKAQHSLGFSQPFGSVTFTRTGTEHPVVGLFESVSGIDGIDSVVVIPAEPSYYTVAQITVHDAHNIPAVTYFAQSIVAPPDPSMLRVNSPTTIADLANAVTSDLTLYSTSILYGVLSIGGIMCAVVVFADALSRRADLGRRLALGASRSTVMVYTIGRTILPAIVGVSIGCIGGMAATAWLGNMAPISFTAGTAVLTLIIMGVSSIPGSLWAANQDPVTILRTP